MKNGLLAAVATAAVLLGGGAQATVAVIGDGQAKVCFRLATYAKPEESALKICREALAQDDLSKRDRAATFVNRGVIEMGLKRMAEAQDDFNKGIALMPDLGEGYLNRGAAFIGQGRFAEALADLDTGLKLGVSRPEIGYYDRGIANEALGNVKAAYEDYRQALAIEPRFERASEQLKRFKVVDVPDGT
jgi:tetratricopeptide (TPR) repeat protein